MTYNLPVLNGTEFDSAVHAAFQEKNLLFSPLMTPYNVAEGHENRTYNIRGTSADAKRVTERFGVTTYQDIDFRKRSINRRKADVDAIPLDEFEMRNINFTPDNQYVQEITNALVRDANKTFIDNFESVVTEQASLTAGGQLVNTTVAFSSDNIIRADSTLASRQTGADYSGGETNLGLTDEKIQQVLEIAEANKVLGDEFEYQIDEGNGLCMLVDRKSVHQLEENVKASNKDYDHYFQWDASRNRLMSYRGIKFIYYSSNSQTFTDGADTIKKLYVWAPKAFIYDQSSIRTFTENNLPDRKHNGHIYAYHYYNTLRVREEAAFRVDVKAN